MAAAWVGRLPAASTLPMNSITASDNLHGFAKFVVVKKPAKPARTGINPFTKQEQTFAAAGEQVREGSARESHQGRRGVRRESARVCEPGTVVPTSSGLNARRVPPGFIAVPSHHGRRRLASRAPV